MLAVQRKEKIKELIYEQKMVYVSKLARLFSVTEETIRRDLAALEGEKVLTRTYGGAFMNEETQKHMQTELGPKSPPTSSSRKIGQQAAMLVNDGDSIFLDSSPEACCMADLLARRNVIIITNSLTVATAVAGTRTRLYLSGGQYSEEIMSFIGGAAISVISRFFFDKCFISCHSLSQDFGVTDDNEYVAEIRRVAVEHASRTYLMCDSTKFGQTSFTSICQVEDIDGIITDQTPDDQWSALLRDEELELFCTDRI